MADRNEILGKIKNSGTASLFRETHSVHSELWDETLYFKNPSIAQQDRYIPLMAQGKLEGYVELIITLALKGENSTQALFEKSDRKVLLNHSTPEEVIRIGEEMLRIIGSEDINEDEAGKSLEGTEG